MVKILGPLALILGIATVGWFILGRTLDLRTLDSDSSQTEKLGAEWGGQQVQLSPLVTGGGKAGVAVPLASSRVDVSLALSQRRKGLLWYNLYDVTFHGRYVVRNDGPKRTLCFWFGLPDGNATYADVSYSIGGTHLGPAEAVRGAWHAIELGAGQSTTVEVAYKSRGMQSWTYSFGSGESSLNDFGLTMSTNFKAIDFPAHGLSPTAEVPTPNGYRLEWRYASLVTGGTIGMVVPYPPQPGPLAQRITMWAPLSLLFYFFVVVLLVTLRRQELHPVNYFFLACAFFAFHLLFAYLVDRVPLEAAFLICSAVSLFLTISYLRLVVGWRFASIESAGAQLVYLVLFSIALCNEGWAGLTITCGAILTLFAAMQVTGRIRWSEYFRSPAEYIAERSR